MRALRFLILLVLLVFLALVAADALLSNWMGLPLHPVRQLISDYKIFPDRLLNNIRIWRAIWGTVLGLVLLYWVISIALFNKRPKAIRTRTSDGDVMLIHPGALLKFVRLQVESHPAVVTHRVRIRQRGNRGLAIWVWINVRPIDSLPNIKRQIEYNIREGFAQIMGIEKIDEVTIVIGLDEKSLSRHPGPLIAPEPRPEAPLRGALAEEAAARYEPPATEPPPRFEPAVHTATPPEEHPPFEVTPPFDLATPPQQEPPPPPAEEPHFAEPAPEPQAPPEWEPEHPIAPESNPEKERT